MGRVVDLGEVTVDSEEMVRFAGRYDPQWYHVDEQRAVASSWAARSPAAGSDPRPVQP